MKALSLFVKPASGGCSMRCAYCLFADEAGGRRVKNLGVMSRETLEELVRKALSEAEESCSFTFTGGEPTLAGLDFFERLVEFEDRHNPNGVAIAHALVTNGLAIDEKWAAFLAKYNFVASVSIDADKKLHDAMRPDRAGKDTHNRAAAAARILAEHGVEHNVVTVLTRGLVSHPDRAYKYYRDRGFKFVHLLPCLEDPDGDEVTNAHIPDDAGFAKFLCRLFDLWYRDFVNGEYLSIRAFDNYVHTLAGHPPANNATGGLFPIVEADGSVYPRELFTGDAHRLGNVMADSFASMLEGDAAKAFTEASDARRGLVDTGEYGELFDGGGQGWVDPVLNVELPLDRYAEAYRQFFDHAKPRLEFLAKRLFADDEAIIQ